MRRRLGWLVLAGFAGCTQAFGIDEGLPKEYTGACTSPSDCLAPADPCLEAVCEAGQCDTGPAPVKTACDGGLCDGQGACVDPACVDGAKGGGEVDTDCGGPCPACPVGADCGAAGDCKSGFCDGGTCALCTSGAQCPGGQTCELASGTCVDAKAVGEPCAGAGECASGACVDGVCCGDACAGLCRACVQAKTGSPDGTCAPVSPNTDPDGDCGTCQACNAGACAPAANGAACGESCANGMSTAGTCQQGSCMQSQPLPCNGHVCEPDGKKCDLDCQADQAQCLANFWCGGFGECNPKKMTGQPCMSGIECMSGSCNGTCT